ncbi:related to Ubiquitin-like protein ATG12 [Nakaseomyces glabratus]|nr:related to Ubiquitin-like protein ATG12 [Nakaseomyces glabratus]SLM13015.1 related to Ubiquitin-like protein ATG12 [Nakaseomyces glabratus]
MSRLLESEQESESGSENLVSSGSIALSKHEEQKRELGVENRLEQYSRRLSQLALVDTNESSDSSEKEEVFVQGSLRSQQSLQASIQSSSHGHTGPHKRL